jgi:hypothetical protein
MSVYRSFRVTKRHDDASETMNKAHPTTGVEITALKSKSLLVLSKVLKIKAPKA